MDNVTIFPSKKVSDKEINLLLNGLIKLIKKSAEENIELELKRECNFATKTALDLTCKLKEKENKIGKLEKEINLLKEQISKMQTQNNIANLIVNNSQF